MSWVQLPLWDDDGKPAVSAETDFSDMMAMPVRPEADAPEPELTPEERRIEAFFSSVAPGENFANQSTDGWDSAGRDSTEVCVLSGWPPRHVQVGQHCPHGLTDDTADEIIDYT